MSRLEYLSHSVAETEELGVRLGEKLPKGSVVAYRGGLGMGKTAFTRGLARGLGCRGRVTSPTFTIVNEYSGPTPLFHFDMYRLESSDALFDIGWEDYLDRGLVTYGLTPYLNNPDNLPPLPEGTVFVTIARHETHDDWRIITVTGGETL